MECLNDEHGQIICKVIVDGEPSGMMNRITKNIFVFGNDEELHREISTKNDNLVVC